MRLEADGRVVESVHSSTDLLENLVAHTRQGAPLLVPPHETRPFMRLLEAVRLATDPQVIAEPHYRVEHKQEHRLRVVPGAAEAVVRAAYELKPFAELELPWMHR